MPLPGVGVGGNGKEENEDYFIKCPQCGGGYPGFQALKEHVESSHPGNGSLACLQCALTFPTRDLLEKHELLHSPNAQVVSNLCSFFFHFLLSVCQPNIYNILLCLSNVILFFVILTVF